MFSILCLCSTGVHAMYSMRCFGFLKFNQTICRKSKRERESHMQTTSNGRRVILQTQQRSIEMQLCVCVFSLRNTESNGDFKPSKSLFLDDCSFHPIATCARIGLFQFNYTSRIRIRLDFSCISYIFTCGPLRSQNKRKHEKITTNQHEKVSNKNQSQTFHETNFE